ncbi:hypothetical protein [Acinetobacter guillouiae]|uniref:hypothetical protein n=1 Tax=Acinetobacter guillouiae TaxID=106649 RepID=UPI002FD8D4F2
MNSDQILDAYDKANTIKDLAEKAQTANEIKKDLEKGPPQTPEEAGETIGRLLLMNPGVNGGAKLSHFTALFI